jgi:hypothetical protein
MEKFMDKKFIRLEVEQLQTEGRVSELINKLTSLSSEHTDGYLTYQVEDASSYGDTWSEFTIYLNREETDKEYEERLIRQSARARLEEEREKKELERLMIKFKLN